MSEPDQLPHRAYAVRTVEQYLRTLHPVHCSSVWELSSSISARRQPEHVVARFSLSSTLTSGIVTTIVSPSGHIVSEPQRNRSDESRGAAYPARRRTRLARDLCEHRTPSPLEREHLERRWEITKQRVGRFRAGRTCAGRSCSGERQSIADGSRGAAHEQARERMARRGKRGNNWLPRAAAPSCLRQPVPPSCPPTT